MTDERGWSSLPLLAAEAPEIEVEGMELVAVSSGPHKISFDLAGYGIRGETGWVPGGEEPFHLEGVVLWTEVEAQDRALEVSDLDVGGLEVRLVRVSPAEPPMYPP